jgi:hypothetical protein
MWWNRTRRPRTIVLIAVTAGVLAVSGCAAGKEGVSSKEACHNGALFLCDNPTPIDQQ